MGAEGPLTEWPTKGVGMMFHVQTRPAMPHVAIQMFVAGHCHRSTVLSVANEEVETRTRPWFGREPKLVNGPRLVVARHKPTWGGRCAVGTGGRK